jgi:plasmid stability protein
MMNAITIRNLSDEVSQALEARAVENGTSAEFEAERILEDVLVPVTIPAQGAWKKISRITGDRFLPRSDIGAKRRF